MFWAMRGKIKKKSMQNWPESADDFLSSGNSEKIQNNFTNQMYMASKNKNFELAAFLRDRLKALKHIAQNNSIKMKDIKNADVLLLIPEREDLYLWKFFIEIFYEEKLFTLIMISY